MEDYNINPHNTSFKISLHVLVMLGVEMRLQMIQNCNLNEYWTS
jgi:hypothetical protein